MTLSATSWLRRVRRFTHHQSRQIRGLPSLRLHSENATVLIRERSTLMIKDLVVRAELEACVTAWDDMAVTSG